RFYENLMGVSDKLPGGPVKPLPKAEALAEAKRWLRGLTPDQVQQLGEGLPRQGTRGRVVKKSATAQAAASLDHPYYWSGFILVELLSQPLHQVLAGRDLLEQVEGQTAAGRDGRLAGRGGVQPGVPGDRLQPRPEAPVRVVLERPHLLGQLEQDPLGDVLGVG